MIDLDAALNRYDEITKAGRNALQSEMKKILLNESEESRPFFDSNEFIADLEHFLNEVLSPDKTYLYAEDFETGKKIEIKEPIYYV